LFVEPWFTGGDIDVLEIVKSGTTLLKQGQWGSPHYRRFQVSSDGTALLWYSVKKPLEHTTIYTADMHLAVLKVALDPVGRVSTDDEASFVIIYGLKKRTLEVVCRTRIEAKIWVEAITYLIKQFNENVELSKIKRYYYHIDGASDSGICPSFQAPIEHSPQLFQQNMNALKRRWSDANSRLNSQGLRNNPVYNGCFEELKLLQQRILRVEQLGDRESVEVFNCMHLTQIELQTLKEKYIVLEQRLDTSHQEGQPPKTRRQQLLRKRSAHQNSRYRHQQKLRANTMELGQFARRSRGVRACDKIV